MTLPAAAIFDLDGTLCDVRPVRHYVTGGNRNMSAFHTASSFCSPNPSVVELFELVQSAGIVPLVVSARPDLWRGLSVGWMTKHSITPDSSWFRTDGDRRPDVDVKRDILADLRRQYRIVLAVDDNPPVIDLWRSEGIETVTVPGFDGSIPIDEPIQIELPTWLADRTPR